MPTIYTIRTIQNGFILKKCGDQDDEKDFVKEAKDVHFRDIDILLKEIEADVKRELDNQGKFEMND